MVAPSDMIIFPLEVNPAKVGALAVVKCCPVLKASWVSPIQSAVTATSSAFEVIQVPAPIFKVAEPPSDTVPPPVRPVPAVYVRDELAKLALAMAVPFQVPVVMTPVLAVTTSPLYEVAPVTAPAIAKLPVKFAVEEIVWAL